MSAFSYDASVSPNPIPANATLTASGANLNASLSLPSFSVLLTPSGDVAEWILSAIAWPLVQVIAVIVTTIINSQVQGDFYPITLTTVSPQNVTLEQGYSVTLTPGNFSLTGGGGYATLTGTVTVS